MRQTETAVLSIDGLISFWNFSESPGEERTALGPHAYRLQEMNGPIRREADGIFGPHAARLEFGQWFRIPRAACKALDIHGPEGQVTVAAWVKWGKSEYNGCEAVAGMWLSLIHI